MKWNFILLPTEVNLFGQKYIFIKLFLGFWDPDGYYFNKEGYDKHGNILKTIISIFKINLIKSNIIFFSILFFCY